MSPNAAQRSFTEWQSGHPPIPAGGVSTLTSAPPPNDWGTASQAWVDWMLEGAGILGWAMTQYGYKMVVASGRGAPPALSRGLPILQAIEAFLNLPEPAEG